MDTSFHSHARKTDKVRASTSGPIEWAPAPLPHPLRGAPSGSAGRGCPPGHRLPRAPAWSGPCRPRLAVAGHARARGGRPAGRSAYLDQLLRGQPWAGGWRRRGLRRRVVVRVFQIVSGEERRVAGRVRSAQHRLELREHRLVLRGRRLGHGSQAGAHGQHPRSHGRSRGGVAGAGHGAIAIPTSPGLARDGGLGAGAAAGGPLGRRPAAHEGGHVDRDSWARPRVTAEVLRPPLSPAPPQSSLARPEPAPATSELHQRAASARTCPATTDT